MEENLFFDRDLSWLSFNERVLQEAQNLRIPPGERLNFLSIYSSNLDEFYRVRIPSLMALDKITTDAASENILQEIKKQINKQQQIFGSLLQAIIDDLKTHHQINLYYNQKLSGDFQEKCKKYFITQVTPLLKPVFLDSETHFFPENNKCYLAICFDDQKKNNLAIMAIPTDILGRFFTTSAEQKKHIFFLDDIIRENLYLIFAERKITGIFSFKVTRDAELDLADEYEGDLVEKLEEQLLKRDMGFATRFLYDAATPEDIIQKLKIALRLENANLVEGGRYHNLKDLSTLPIKDHPAMYNTKWTPIKINPTSSIFEKMRRSDFLLHPPYQDYETVLQFFSEAAKDENVTEIYTTIYRVARDSKIAQSLIQAVKNGKKVTVFVELKARFDEENNIHWGKTMKAEGVKIIYSIPGLKVHSKIALVKKKNGERVDYFGLLGTGNFNESTAKIYADQILFSTHKDLLRELELVFLYLSKRKKSNENVYQLSFQKLLVARFNLLPRFMGLIDDEILEAKSGRPAEIKIKLNNLEEEMLITKLYEASQAGVKISLIVRGICRLIPGVEGMSENISVRRIIDRYLEHGRIFIFHHGGDEQIFCGSADWMKRNIFRRIEVSFPIENQKAKEELKEIIRLELADNVQAVTLDRYLNNIKVPEIPPLIASQKEIYEYLKHKKS